MVTTTPEKTLCFVGTWKARWLAKKTSRNLCYEHPIPVLPDTHCIHFYVLLTSSISLEYLRESLEMSCPSSPCLDSYTICFLILWAARSTFISCLLMFQWGTYLHSDHTQQEFRIAGQVATFRTVLIGEAIWKCNVHQLSGIHFFRHHGEKSLDGMRIGRLLSILQGR